MPLDNTINHAIERILPYVAQSQGFYSGLMMTEEYASLYTCNYQYMLDAIVNKIIYNDIFHGELKSFGDVFPWTGNCFPFAGNIRAYIFMEQEHMGKSVLNFFKNVHLL